MITPSQIPNPYVKPKWQASVGIMESVVAYNCRKYGMPHPALAMPMWEGAGDRALDLSGYGNHGTNNGADWVADGLDFVRANGDYVDAGDADSLSFSGSFTISTWVNLTSKPDNMHIIFKGSNAATDLEYALSYILSSDRFRFYTGNGVGFSFVEANNFGSPLLSSWYHIIGLYDDDTDSSKIYINSGTPNVENNVLNGHNDEIGLGIGGALGGTSKPFNGAQSNVQIFNAALTAAQIKFLYDDPYFMYRMPEELYGYTSAAPPPVSIPVFMHHYNQLRGA